MGARRWKHRVGGFAAPDERAEFLARHWRSWNDGAVLVDVRWFDRALTDAEVAALAKKELPHGQR